MRCFTACWFIAIFHALQAALIPVPAQLFQGSLLLGSIVKAGLGQAALTGANVLVHPLLVAGWCGMVSTALNLLPVGRIDGGRMMQVRRTSTTSLSLPLCRRTPTSVALLHSTCGCSHARCGRKALAYWVKV
jgi:hypothetical protein